MKRDWPALAREKERFWALRLAEAEPGEALEIAENLRLEALAIQPDWPSPEERLEDLKAHEALSERMRRATPNRPV